MFKLNVMALLLGAALFTGMGTVSLSAEGMKCGAGKCGGSVMKKAACDCETKCNDSKSCDHGKKCSTKGCAHDAKNMKCGSGKCGASQTSPTVKCGGGKCGNAKKAPAKKCGVGKCGS